MTVFYKIPARELVPGVSTDTGMDVMDVYFPDYAGYVQFSTQTPGEVNSGDTLLYEEEDLVDLAVFPDTRVDLSGKSSARDIREVR
jgi:hypothetical protein